MRLIDADLLELDADYDDGEYWAVSMAQIHNAPIIEPKKGRWMRKVEPYAWRWETWVCSECGEEITSTIMGKPRYQWCPMCGADMREGEAEC